MVFNYNHITLVGRAHIVESKTLDYTVKTTLKLKVDRPYRKEDGTVDSDLIPVTLWGELAEMASRYITENRDVLIEGRVTIEDGETFIVAENFQLLEN